MIHDLGGPVRILFESRLSPGGDDLGELHTTKDNECQDIQTAKVLTSKEYDFYALLTSSCVFWEPMVSVGWNVPSTR